MAYGEREELIDSRVMIQADREHLAKALTQGDRTQAHTFVDSIIDLGRRIEDLEAAVRGLPNEPDVAAAEK